MSPQSGTVAVGLARFGGLTDRDRALLRALDRHRVLTTAQIAKLFFGTLDTARHRLTLLHRRELVARWRHPVWPGSQSWRYALSPAGAHVHAATTGAPLARPAKITEHLVRLAASPHTAHLIGVNGVFADLTWWGRTHPGASLVQWWPEAIAADACAGIVRPDGYGEWDDHGVTLRFFLEYDRGTETQATLLAKIDKYAALAATGIRHPVLIVFTATAREANFHRALTGQSPALPSTRQAARATTGQRPAPRATARNGAAQNGAAPRDGSASRDGSAARVVVATTTLVHRDERDGLPDRVPIATDPVWALAGRAGHHRLTDLSAITGTCTAPVLRSHDGEHHRDQYRDGEYGDGAYRPQR